MPGFLKFRKIKPQMIFWFFTAALLPVIIVSSIIYHQRVIAIKTEAFNKLTAIRNLKVSQLNWWMEERKSDLRFLADDLEIRHLVTSTEKANNIHNIQNARKSTRSTLDLFVKKYNAYHEIFIINATTGIVSMSSDITSVGLDVSNMPFFTEPLKTGSFFFRDIYYSKQLDKPTMCLSIPIQSLEETGQNNSGIIVARINLEQSLYSLLLERPGMGKTGETLLVNSDVMALNELRWHDNAPLRLKIEAKPAVLASKGNAGIIETLDYRGEKVLASYTYLPFSGWGFVAKQDLSEIYAPIHKMIINILIILLLATLFAYVLAHTLALNFSNPVMELSEIARRIQAGDYSVRSTIEREDEYGILGRAFNRMTESVDAFRQTQKCLRDLDEIIVASTTPDEFASRFTEGLLSITNASFGAFYLIDPDRDSFQLIYSSGLDNERLESISKSTIAGSFTAACSTKKVTYINNIPKETVFTVNTIAGIAIPRSIVTIPIIVDRKPAAIITLGSLTKFSDTSAAIMEQIQAGTGTALSNLLAEEKRAVLARDLKEKNLFLESQARELQVMTDNLKNHNIELDIQSSKLEEANRMKSVFLSNMSHELRTPLNSVMALSSVLKSDAAHKLAPDELEYLDVIERNGKRLLDLINDILDLAKIEAGYMDVVLSFFPVSTLVENILDSLRPLARDKDLSMQVESISKQKNIQSDEKRVHQILMNIISNAVKFTEKGKITVQLTDIVNSICVKITDTGIGIPESELPHIFDEFKQVDSSTSRSHEGTGLGLAIAHKAAKNLGGNLSVESKKGTGTTFTLELPLKWCGNVEPTAAAIPFREKDFTDKQKTVLIVDDDFGAAELIAEHISLEGYNTLTAYSGAEALRLAKKHNPFAITLDLLMPDMDGLETLQRLKNDEKTAGIPVIIVSVSADYKTGIALGAVGHITKPVNRNELIQMIKQICKKPDSILVTDDSEVDRKMILRTLSRENLHATGVDSGENCLEEIRRSMPDVLILDLLMPDMNGFDVLKALRSDPSTITLPVIILTAKDITPDERMLLNQYVVSVLYKNNLTSDDLLNKIKTILVEIEKKEAFESDVTSPSGKQILVVEDNETAIIQIKMFLEHAGFVVITANSGKQAYEIIQHTIPDGIILDLMMPEIDGFAVLEKLRGTEETATIPVLILTAKDLTPDDFKKLSANNIQQLVQKGDVEREELLQKVKIMMGERENTITDNTKIDISPKIVNNNTPLISKDSTELPTILIIEDNPDNMLTLKAILKNRYITIEANDGKTGLNKVFLDLPDIILLDISLPGMDGYTIAKKLKSEEITRRIPIIALTAHAMKGDKDKILSAGCDEFISKPIDPATILETIEKQLGLKLETKG